MRRIFLFLLTVCLTFVSAGIQANDETTLYIYRNDGGFDAFYYAEIDSMVYSTLDADSVEHSDYVTQEIWTASGVSRIPLAAIDSVCFTTPPTIVNSDVFPLTAEHVPYIVSADTLNFVMLKATPAGMRPQKGNIVAAEADCTSFPNGIMARVLSVTETSGGYSYVCERATIEDVYDQIVFYGDVSGDGSGRSEMPKRAAADGAGWKFLLWQEDFDAQMALNSNVTMSVNAREEATFNLKIAKLPGRGMYARFGLGNTVTAALGLDAKYEGEVYGEKQIGSTIKFGKISFPYPPLRFLWLEPQLTFTVYGKVSGHAELNYSYRYTRTDEMFMEYQDGAWNCGFVPTADAEPEVSSITLQGSVEVGVIPKILLALNGSQTGVGARVTVGLKTTADFSYDGTGEIDTRAYDLLKETKVSTNVMYGTTLFAQLALSKNNKWGCDYSIANNEYLLKENYLLPAFKEGDQWIGNTSHTVGVTTSRDLLAPVELGMALYDRDGNLLQTVHDGDIYKSNGGSYLYTFENIPRDKAYKVYPLVKLGPVEMRAAPGIELDVCPAEITNVETTGAQYVRGDEKPNHLKFDLNASLYATEDIEEWGVYSGSNKEFPFDDVASSAIDYFICALPEYSTSDYYRIDYNNFVVEYDGSLGVYVKKRNRQDNSVKTIYGPKYAFTLLYDTWPSVTLKNPVITGTEIVETKVRTDADGNEYVDNRYKTTTNYTTSVKGSFWIDYIDSGSTWSLYTNEPWYPKSDGDYDSSWNLWYWDSTSPHECSSWYIIHMRNNSRTFNSDYLNQSGDNIITNVWISSYPAYTPKRNVSGEDAAVDGERMNSVEVFPPIEKEEVTAGVRRHMVIPCDDGFLVEE